MTWTRYDDVRDRIALTRGSYRGDSIASSQAASDNAEVLWVALSSSVIRIGALGVATLYQSAFSMVPGVSNVDWTGNAVTRCEFGCPDRPLHALVRRMSKSVRETECSPCRPSTSDQWNVAVAQGTLHTPEQFEELLVAPVGDPVRLRDVARVDWSETP